MLTPIAQSHLAALEAELHATRAQVDLYAGAAESARASASQMESELARVTAQRDALRDACLQFVAKSGNSHVWNAVELDLCRKIARNALQACQD